MSKRFRHIIAIYARHEETGRIEHHEWLDATGIASAENVRWVSGRTDELIKTFSLEHYDVYEEGYDSLQTMQGRHPMLRTIPRPEDTRQRLIAFFARSLVSGDVQRIEVVDWSMVAGDSLADRIDARLVELEAIWDADQYELFWEGYDSESSMLRGHPESHVRRVISR